MNAHSGLRLPAPFAHYDPDMSCWRTWQPSLLPESLPEQPPTWPRSGTWDLGAAYEQPTSELLTDEPGSSSLLPTPDAGRFNDGQTVEVYRERLARLKAKHNNGNGAGTPLAMAVQLLPTPNAADGMGGPGNSGRDGGLNLRTAAVELLPTPRSQNGEERNQNIWARPLDEPQNLENALARLPGVPTSPPFDAGNEP